MIFLIRIDSTNEGTKFPVGKKHVAWEGTEFPRDRHKPFSNLYHQRLVIAVDWKISFDKSKFLALPFVDHESFVRHTKSLGADVGGSTLRDRRLGLAPSVTLEECLCAYAGAEEQLDENSWYVCL